MKRRLTLLISTMLIISILISMFVLPASATYNDDVTAPNFESNVVYMESLDYGTVIFDRNSKMEVAIASLTKITTALVVLENCKDLNKKVTAEQATLNTLAGTDSSTAGIKAGETLTVRQLLNLLLVRSANEAACILAEYVGGSIDNFVVMMNEYVTKLGCKNTHYMNVHGLDAEGHYSTAEDLAIIIKHALKNETFVDITSQPSYTLEATNMRDQITYSNTNLLLMKNSGYYYEYCSGIKTGSTDDAGLCLASVAEKNGCRYLCIVMGGQYVGANKANGAFKETIQAYKWVYDNIQLRIVAKKTEPVHVVDVDLAKGTDHVRLVPAEDVTALIPVNVDTTSILIEPIKGSIPESVKAPIKAGDVIGKANVTFGGDIIATVDLVAGEDVERGFFSALGYYLGKFLKSTFMKVVYVILGACILIILGLRSYNKKRKEANRIRVVHSSNHYKAKPNTKYSKNYKKSNYKKR